MKQSLLEAVKYINDPVYGSIPINQIELDLISLPIFQRLRGLRQLARVNLVFPGAEHSRFVHSLGVLYIMEMMTEHLLKNKQIIEEDAVKLRVAALLHDIGHYPLSHLGEASYSFIKDNAAASDILTRIENQPLYDLASSHSNSAHHERLGEHIVKNNIQILAVLKKHNIDPEEIANIFTGDIGSRNLIYMQLLHSSLDADRLDYLLRDSYQTGVKYGLVDLQYLIRLLVVANDPRLSMNAIACNKKGQHVVEHYLMCRYFHYSQVIFHKTNAAFEGMIKAMYIKLLQGNAFIYNSIEEIHNNVNNPQFLDFNDSILEVAFKDYYYKTTDSEYKALYKMYIERRRPKVVLEMKDLYDESPSPQFSVLKWELKQNPQKITELLDSGLWGYQIVSIKLEKIQSHNRLSEDVAGHIEELREAVRVYDIEADKMAFLAEDNLSVISRLSNYRSEFIRIFMLDEPEKNCDFAKITQSLKSLIAT